eukprot:1394782-Prymnesium_polylepis.1
MPFRLAENGVRWTPPTLPRHDRTAPPRATPRTGGRARPHAPHLSTPRVGSRDTAVCRPTPQGRLQRHCASLHLF